MSLAFCDVEDLQAYNLQKQSSRMVPKLLHKEAEFLPRLISLEKRLGSIVACASADLKYLVAIYNVK